MTTLKKRHVKQAKKRYTCSECGRTINPGSPYTYLYGFVDVGERPFVLRFCPTCQDEYDKESATPAPAPGDVEFIAALERQGENDDGPLQTLQR